VDVVELGSGGGVIANRLQPVQHYLHSMHIEKHSISLQTGRPMLESSRCPSAADPSLEVRTGCGAEQSFSCRYQGMC
jgi:hypothetical protein